MTAVVTAEVPQCGARTRSGGGHACRLVAGHGTPGRGIPGARCKYHAGLTPSGLAHAEYRAAEHALRKLGEPIPTDPLEGLQRAVDSAAGLHAGLQRLVREAADAESPDSRQLIARLGLFTDSIDRLARVASQAVTAKLTERQAALTNAQGARLVVVVEAALKRLGLTPPQLADARRFLADEIIRTNPEGGTTP
jgi:hypothetical protein